MISCRYLPVIGCVIPFRVEVIKWCAMKRPVVVCFHSQVQTMLQNLYKRQNLFSYTVLHNKTLSHLLENVIM